MTSYRFASISVRPSALGHVHIFALDFYLETQKMASILTGAAKAAHSAAATVLSAVPLQVGDPIPSKMVKEDDPERPITLDLAGKNVIVSVSLPPRRN